MKHGLALLAAGLVLLAGALLVACPPLALAAGAEVCLAQVSLEHVGRGCMLFAPDNLGLAGGAPGTATIFLLGGLAALASGIVALRVSCPPTHARRGPRRY